jgi:hypothetical protein
MGVAIGIGFVCKRPLVESRMKRVSDDRKGLQILSNDCFA